MVNARTSSSVCRSSGRQDVSAQGCDHLRVLDPPGSPTAATLVPSTFGPSTADPPRAAVASLTAALRNVSVTGNFYCPSYLREPWGLTLPPMPNCVWFHAMASGNCTLEVGSLRLDVRAGDFVLVPHGTGHRISAGAPTNHPLVTELPHDERTDDFAVLHHGGDGALTEAVCGGLRLEHPMSRRILDSLPPVVHVPSARHSPLSATLDLLALEVHARAIGSEAVVSRLCDIVVIQAIREWLASGDCTRSPWLAGMSDPSIGPALAAIHADPAGSWTVAGLAELAAMSRSAFAARFRQLVDRPVMDYVSDVRMQHALDLLHRGDLTVSQIASAVGYESDPAFGRAFKRYCGISPGEARSRATTDASPN